MNDKTPVKLGFLASGRGSNMLSIINACNDAVLNAKPAVVISNNVSSGALAYARQANIPAFHLSSNTHPAPDELDAEITDCLRQYSVELVVLAGFMKKVGPQVLAAFRNRVINIHPSLLPKFGGQGLYGIKVHAAVLAAQEKETGVTIHLVDDEYDEGQILAQHSVPVKPDDTAETLAARVLEVEHKLYLATLKKIIEGEISLP